MSPAPTRLTTVVSTEGQVILPEVIRDQLDWPAGIRFSVENTKEGVLLKALPLFEATKVEAVFGSLGKKAPCRSLDDMDDAIAAEARRRAGS